MDTRTVTNADLTREERLRQRLYVESRQDGGNPSEFLEMLASVVEQRLWENLGISFVDLIEKEYPTGIGSSRDEIKTMIRLHHKHEAGNPKLRDRMDEMRKKVDTLLKEGEPELGEHGGDRRTQESSLQGDNITLKGRGTDPTYVLRRLKRDHEDLAEKVIRGEMSANAAAIEAGFRKKTITVPADLDGATDALIKRFGADALYEIVRQKVGRGSGGSRA